VFEAHASRNGGEPIVAVADLVKRYASATANAVDGVSFEVRPGEFFALLGPNGAGKTTTISVLTTTLLPTSGTVTIAGHDVVREANAVRHSAGIIFQRPSLDRNLTAEENVRLHAILYGLFPFRPAYRLMPERYRQEVARLAVVLGLEDQIFRPIRTFSGGMMRKLEIMRSLIHTPRVLFLDEPTTGLDPASRRGLWAYLDETRRAHGTTLFLTTHYLEEAEKADRICVLDHGRIVALGAPAEIKDALVERYVVLSAADAGALRAELDARGVAWRPWPDPPDAVRVDVRPAEVHPLLRAIETPLDRIHTHIPSLEDAYLELIERGTAARDDEGGATEPVGEADRPVEAVAP